MELGFKVVVLLAFAFSSVVGLDTTVTYDCPANKYEHKQGLLNLLNGWLYTQYSTAPLGDNEIFDCRTKIFKGNVYCRTTFDNECCRAFNVTKIPKNFKLLDKTAKYLQYEIETAPTGCSVGVDEVANLKLISSHRDKNGYCIILWTCRKSREGVHAFCSTQEISKGQQEWIQNEFKEIDSSLVPKVKVVKQNTDYRSGICFPAS